MNLEKLDNYLIFDGAFGTMLQKKNLLELGELPPILNITKPKEITEIFNEYVDAGSDVVTTNTFEANRIKLKDSPYSVDEVVKSAVKAAKDSKAKYIALDIGPTGKLLKPIGELSFNDAYDIFKEIVLAAEDKTDFIILETFSDLLELKAALLAVKENSNLPVICSMTFSEDGRTFTGTSPESFGYTVQELGADALGVNCSLGPEDLIPIVEKITEISNVPVIVQANAGLPKLEDGETIYSVTPESYSSAVSKMVDMGVKILGGCCGTNPDYIRSLKNLVGEKTYIKPSVKKRDVLTTSTGVTYIDDGIKVVGERINPTGREHLKEALRNKSYGPILSEGLKQEKEGADILDVNVGLPEIDEKEALSQVITELSGVTSLPLQIDTTNIEALEEALRVYPGIPIINSVNGTEESLSSVLPLVKKYGAYVIGLTLDENGIPKTSDERIKIAEKIIKRAERLGIDKSKIIIDALVLTASAQQPEVMVTLDTVRRLKEELGVKTTLGVSNVSFGLPERDLFNSVFLTAALTEGLDLPIINPASVPIQNALSVFKVINNEDKNSEAYIDRLSGQKKEEVIIEKNDDRSLKDLIIDGLKEEAEQETRRLLMDNEPGEIVSTFFIPALEHVGTKFETGEIFLPQLMQSASAVQASFNIIKEETKNSKNKELDKGKILLATVKGDIHDIGKNIVKMMLENYGYKVYDLGNDVDSDLIIQKAKELDTPLIGLSALMTTTVESMREVISKLKENNMDNKVVVGGAVLTQDYADLIGADYYANDAQATVRIANEFFNKE